MDQRLVLTMLSSAERKACQKALRAICERGVAHGDVRGANLLLRNIESGGDRQPVFIDSGFTLFDTDTEFKEAKKKNYYRLLDAFKGTSVCV
ncbi:hypothetical protein IW140_005190 [Coemansia sp. RSA 1813]|nr:hypothetical protein EV178_003781 [Coemansia sp. RSA 1646]KAJ2089017.1 hypothetical protein IW138_003729 [Coemansia sp. RSA 986]KAJ2565848.1 hypothetical protein IW140_005190 [Coemansia sp. RSA 1813]